MSKLRRHQRIGVRKIKRARGRTLLADEMGLGKSLQALWYAMKGRHYPVIIVCPSGLKANWQAEISHHLGMRSAIVNSNKKSKQAKRAIRSTKFVIISYNMLGSWTKQLRKLKPGLVIIDEGHYIQSRFTQRTQNVYALCRKQQRILILTGTPIGNTPVNIWPIIHLLWPERFSSFTTFAWKYCEPKKTPWGWQYKGAKNLPRLHRRLIKAGMIRRRKADVLKSLPKKARYVVPLTLDNRREYDRAENHFIQWLMSIGHKRLFGALKAERLVKMGYLKRLAARLKMKAVFEWIDDFLRNSEGKLLLFAVHKKIVQALHTRYQKLSVVIDGSKSNDERRRAEKRFQNDDKVRILIGNIKAAGVGLNLTAADTVAFIELPWKPADCEQAEDRCYGRLNDLHGASCYYLIAHNTIEERLCEIIQTKQKISATAIDGGKGKHSLNVLDLLAKVMRRRAA